MKPLLALLLAVGIGYVSYKYVYPPFGAYFGIDKPTPKVVVVEKPVVLEMPKVEVKRQPKPEPKPEPKVEMPVVAAPPPPPPPPKPKADEFVPPTFAPIEEVTKNWTMVSKSVFPRQVKISKDIEVKSQIGATKIAAGGMAYAISQDGADLIMAPSPESPFRGRLGLDDTNIKEIVIAAYEGYKTRTIEAARQAFEAKKMAAKNPKAAATKAGPVADTKPEKSADGTFAILLDSMKSGEVTEIKPENIKKWGDVTREKADKDSFWAVTVTFEATTPFGKFEQDAQAQIKNGKVTKWIYTGSGEIVP